MTSKLRSLLIGLFLTCAFFASNAQIKSCYFSFDKPSGLTYTAPDKLPENAEKYRTVKTEHGEVQLSRIDGYRVLYNNDKNVPFVNLKVELSESSAYETDKINLIANLRYLNAHSVNMETQNLIELKFNGYSIFGSSRGSIESGSILGTFVMFPGNGVVVYFYFNNLKPDYRHFSTVEEYKKSRDRFMNEYTSFLKTCLK